MSEIHVVNYDEIGSNKEHLYRSFTLTSANLGPLIGTGKNEPFVYEGFCWCVCRSGYARVHVNFKEYIFEPGKMIVVLPRFIIQVLSCSDDFRSTIMVAGTHLIDDIQLTLVMPLFQQIHDVPLMQLSSEKDEQLMRLLDCANRVVLNRQHPYRKEMLRTLISAIALEICAVFSNQQQLQSAIDKNNHKDFIFKQFFNDLNEFYIEHHEVSFYAERQYLTPKYLSIVVREISGYTASYWIDKMVILKAKSYLRHDDMSIQQVAYKLNFPNPSFFGQYFKKHVGITPRQYRITECNL